MGNDRKLLFAIRAALATAATISAIPAALSQTVAANTETTASETSLQEVVVTGSRIAVAPNDISISPITTVSQLDIQQTGLIRTEDILNSLPSITAEQGSGQSISSTGTSTVSLRDLGSQRTLVLVNGVRMNPGGAGGISGGNANAADINQIPSELIERVDVLTGGASSVYGADAVAGVVNFVLNTHYDGVKVDADYGFYRHSNNDQGDLTALSNFGATLPPSTVDTGQQKQISIVAGSNFADGKGNATAYFEYFNAGAAVGYQFDHAGCTLIGGATPSTPITCGGSGTSPHTHILELGGTNGATIISDAVDPKTGVLRPYTSADDYNYGALSYFQRPAERYSAGVFLHYDVNEYASVYLQTMFARNTSTAQYGPSGAFFPLENISCANPLLTAQEVGVLCNPATLAQNHLVYPTIAANSFTAYIARRNVEGGGREDNYASNSIFQTVGVKGHFADGWSYDAYGKVGITQFGDREADFLGVNQVNNALNVVTNPAVGGAKGVPVGAPVCASVLNGTDTACVPWNIFTPGGVTAAALNYLNIPSSWSTTATEYIASNSVTGDLGKYGVQIPTAKDGLSVNVGSEYREEKFQFSPDYVYANGLASGGSPSGPIAGGFHVFEGFSEARLPIMNDMPGAYNLSAEVGYRYSSYLEQFDKFDTNTFKVGLEWAPIKDVRLRGGFNRAIRAPNIDELYGPAAVGAGGVADPCWGPSPLLSLTQCERTGVTATEYGHIAVNEAAQINTQTGGNAELRPEIADTYTYGIVFQPTFIPNLVASLDFYRIVISDTITQLSPTNVVSDCAFTGQASTCGLINRGPSGSLWLSTANYVQTTERNIGTVQTKGFDFTAHYLLDAGIGGKVSFNLTDTYTMNFITQPISGGLSYDCAGYWGATCGSPLPHLRQVLTTNWATPLPGFDFTVKWRFIGPSKVDSESQNPLLHVSGPFYTQTSQISGYNYIDLSANYSVNSVVDFRMGVNNLFDKDPPTILTGTLSNCPNTTCNDNTWTGTYDTLGRYLYAHVTLKF